MPMPGVLAESFPQIAERIGVTLPHVWDLSTYDDEVATTLTINQINSLSSFTGVSIEALIGLEPLVQTGASNLLPEDFCELIHSHIEGSGSSVAEFEESAGWDIERILGDPSQLYDLANWDCLRDIARVIGVDPVRVLPRGNSTSEQGVADQRTARRE